tara:strand:+ start:1360 stop:3045 length:1686 start_codon:yes stop_codon:yes gene_type:complete
MKVRIFLLLLYTFIFLGISNSSFGKNINFNYDAKSISSYFSGLVSFDEYDYINSEKFFKKINNINYSTRYSSKYIQSLVNLERYNQAKLYSKRLDRKNLKNFEVNLFLGISELKRNKFSKAYDYFSKLEPNFEHQMIFNILKISLKNWMEIADDKNGNGTEIIDKMLLRKSNFNEIQKIFANCYFDNTKTMQVFNESISNKEYNLSRYRFFQSNYLANNKKISEAKNIIKLGSKENPSNLLINQFNKTLFNGEENKNDFSCKNIQHIVAELLYVLANALSNQENYKLSNFYINLSKYLNPKFLSYNSLLAENFLMLGKYNKSREIYKKLSEVGSIYGWYSSRRIAIILTEEGKDKESINFLTKAYEKISPNHYQAFDFANFLRSNEEFKKSIDLYSKILSEINKEHELYPKLLDRRGTAYERTGNWALAEKDLILSLQISPNEPYVMNYLAYSWIENGENIEEALRMLRKANDLKKNDGYITDSLGWGLYKLNNFKDAKLYLEKAIVLMPTDPIVNDHFADCLWKNNQKIQARYYWNYVLSLKTTDEKLKKTIKNKLLFGL